MQPLEKPTVAFPKSLLLPFVVSLALHLGAALLLALRPWNPPALASHRLEVRIIPAQTKPVTDNSAVDEPLAVDEAPIREDSASSSEMKSGLSQLPRFIGGPDLRELELFPVRIPVKTRLRVFVNRLGVAERVEIITTDPLPLELQELITAAIRQAKFSPGSENGKPVDSYFEMVMELNSEAAVY